jgi:phosphoribosylpyrophosphate synthetase
MMLLSLYGASALAQGVAERLGEPLAPLEHRPFHDGEHKWRPLEDPRGCDVFVLAALHGDDEYSPQDKLVRLLFMLGTLRDHGAHRVTAVLPYLAYARKDVRTQPFDPLATQALARWQHPVGFAMVDKRRVGGLVTSNQLVAGDADGATVLLLDDIVASGGTLVHAAAALHHAGAAAVHGFAAHGLFIDDADRVLTASHLARLVVSDSVPAFRMPNSTAFASRLQVTSVASVLARAMAQVHQIGH